MWKADHDDQILGGSQRQRVDRVIAVGGRCMLSLVESKSRSYLATSKASLMQRQRGAQVSWLSAAVLSLAM